MHSLLTCRTLIQQKPPIRCLTSGEINPVEIGGSTEDCLARIETTVNTMVERYKHQNPDNTQLATSTTMENTASATSAPPATAGANALAQECSWGVSHDVIEPIVCAREIPLTLFSDRNALEKSHVMSLEFPTLANRTMASQTYW